MSRPPNRMPPGRRPEDGPERRPGDGRTQPPTPAWSRMLPWLLILGLIGVFALTNLFSSDGGGTKVTWTMEGPMDLMSKFFTLFMSMDKSVGGDFESGLAKLKKLSEAAPAAN